MLKKVLCAVLAGAMIIPMTACSSDPVDETTDTSSETEITETAEPAEDEFGYEGIDHIITVPDGKDITVLQLADIQAMLYEGIRTSFYSESGRLINYRERHGQVVNTFFKTGVTDTYTISWQYVEEAVAKTNPDIIVLTGDNIYGETDDSGELWLEMIGVLDSFEIPWLCVFGNHDNESQKGVNWQIEAVQNSKYGYMKDGDLQNGNCNYNVGIVQGGQLKYVFYSLDTNGCRVKSNLCESMLATNPDIADIQQAEGIYPDQLEWMQSRSALISSYAGNVPSMLFMHIPPIETYYSVTATYSDTYGAGWPFYTDRNSDIGMATEYIGGIDTAGKLFETAKAVNCVGMFVGHQHKVATSTYYDGIRLTYGLKTGCGDYHDTSMLGSTKITISEADNSFDVEYVFSDIEYPLA